jgi:hypothetical protein
MQLIGEVADSFAFHGPLHRTGKLLAGLKHEQLKKV